jgi:hypothetical protein
MATIDREQLKNRMKALLSSLPCNSVAFPYVIHYLLFEPSKPVSSWRLFESLSLNSVEMISLIDVFAAQFGPLVPIMKLVKSGMADRTFHRACFSAARKLILAFPDETSVRDWVTVCVRRLVIFVALATGRQKYHNKTMLVCESLCGFGNMQIGWLRDAVFGAGAGILPSRSIPIYFTGFVRMTGEPDDSTLWEFTTFLKQKVNLKVFPFDSDKLRLTPPVAIEPAGSAQSLPAVLQLPPLPKRSKEPSAKRCPAPHGKKRGCSVLHMINPWFFLRHI